MTSKKIRKEQLTHDIEQFFEHNYFDVQSFHKSPTIDEAYLARVLTKLAIGSATVWWSLLEVKDFFILRRKSQSK
jgi:hypothetical protein